MIIRKGKTGTHLTHQDDFPETTECTCGGTARMALSAKEETEEQFYICDLYKNKGKGGFWPHDAIAIAVYLCKECMKPAVLFNQG